MSRTRSLRAIETRYKGYRFRSRLEARWAVLFDALGIRWEYEAQGFELPSGQRYLPDFILPDLGRFAEVKPLPLFDRLRVSAPIGDACGEHHHELFDRAGRAVRLADLFDARHLELVDAAQTPLLFLGGSPRVAPVVQLEPGEENSRCGIGFVDLVATVRREQIAEWCTHPECRAARDPILDAAVGKALGARFEHGESPA